MWRFRTVPASAWFLLAAALMAALGPRVLLQLGLYEAHTALYFVQPAATVLVALLAHSLLHGRRDRIRHKGDKAFVVLSVLAVWFVAYFLSGLVVTFVHNALLTTWQNIIMNVLSFGLAAAAVEYVRYTLMLLAGRRNLVWFGALVGLVLAMQQLGLLQFSAQDALVDTIKFAITYVVPAIVTSMLLTFLSITSGLGVQLTYSLSTVALTLLPPIIPKYDWYMTSMSQILLAIGTYIMIDRSKGVSDEERVRRHHRRPRVAFDFMFGLVMISLVLFMTGAFAYRPVVIMSNSMVPVFARGDVVVVQKLRDPVDIQIGDIIQYQAENKTITHRVVAIDTANDDSGDRVFTTKGDNSPSKDPSVKQGQVVGVIRSSVPYAGYPTVWLQEMSRKN